MRKDLELWLRGGTAQEPETVTNVADLHFPPQAPDVAPSDVHGDILTDSADEPVPEVPAELVVPSEEEIEEIETAVERFPVKNLSDTEASVEKPFEPDDTLIESGEPDGNEIYDKNENNYEDSEKRPAGGLLEEARSRLIAMRVTRMNDSQRVGHIYERSGFRRNRRRFFTLCVLAVIVVSTVIALYRNMRRNSYDAIMERAGELYEQKQYAVALEAYNDASLRYPDRPEPFLGTAHAAERLGRAEESIVAYQASLEHFPPDDTHSRAGVFYEIGRLHSTLKAWEKAQENFEEAIAADAANFAAYFSLGDSLEEQDKPDEAIEAYTRALELSPASDAAREAVKRVSLTLAAKEEEEKDALVEQKYEQAFNSGAAALKWERYREASQYFADALAIRSDDANAWVGFAEARDKLGDSAGARKSLERALERDPAHESAKSKLAEMETQDRQPVRNAPRRRNSSSSPRSSAETQETSASREAMFKAGLEQYDKGEYKASFNSFIACLRSSENEPLPPVSLAGLAGDSWPVWKAPQTRLNISSEAGLLAEAVRLNPKDRDLYVNLSMAGSKIGIDRKTMRSVLLEARSHAQDRAGDI